MLRLATANEIPALNKLIEQSARTLNQNDYSKNEIESAIRYVFGVDTELVEDKTYYVIENNGVIQACGGWSKRKTLFGGNQFNQRESGYLDPKIDAAKIRAFFVHPDYARQGLGTILLNYCEQQALAHGFSKTEMMATLSGVKLYQARGYSALCEKGHLLPNGVSLKFVHMTKNILQLNSSIITPTQKSGQDQNTKDQKLGAEDLFKLEQAGIAERWVGTRAVAYDGFPILGAVYNADGKVSNAGCTTHLGSGGGSFSPASIFASRSILNNQAQPDKLTQDVLKYGSSNRKFG